MLARSCLLISSAALVGGCSAIIDTDPDVFGSDVTLPDSGPPILVDGGARDLGPNPPDMGARPDMPPAACPAPPQCVGGDSLVCEGGERVTVPCPGGCNGATGECLPPATGFTPSNVGRDQFRDGPDLDLDEAFRYDTDACTSMTGAARVVAMRDGGEACVLSVGSFRLRAGGFMQVGGQRPLIIVANDEIRIEGVIDVSARGDQAGPAGEPGGRTVSGAADGEGPGGGITGVHEGDFDDGGGGGGGGCGGGGDGGQGGEGAGGEGGSPFLDGNDLQPLFGGSGGGRGRGAIRAGGFSNAGEGGAGGGALQLTAANRIVIGGGVVAGGGGGQPGRNNGDAGTNWGSGGGGGAGGNVIVEAPEIEVGGGLSVVGGGGGGGSSSGGSGGAGQDGLDGATAQPSGGDSGGSQYGSPGGDGAGLATVGGEGGGSNTADFANGGGGGGGAGCVVVRSSSSASVPVNPPASVTTLSLLP